jgi:hypothetical protein
VAGSQLRQYATLRAGEPGVHPLCVLARGGVAEEGEAREAARTSLNFGSDCISLVLFR